jgi:hypothetical protein
LVRERAQAKPNAGAPPLWLVMHNAKLNRQINQKRNMTDQQFLWWIHERLVKIHGESEMMGYMHHMRAIILDTPPDKETPRIVRMDTDADVMRKQFG